MHTTSPYERDSRLGDLMRELPEELKLLVRQELALAKAELSEKARHLKMSFAVMGVGAGMAAVASILGMAGLALLVAVGFQAAGLSAVLANALAFLLVSFVFAGIGLVVARAAAKRLSSEGFVPKRTLQTLKSAPKAASGSGQPPKPNIESNSSESETEERKADVDRTQRRVNETVEQIQQRLQPDYLLHVTIPRELRQHPMRTAMIGASAAFAGVYILNRLVISPVRSLLGRMHR